MGWGPGRTAGTGSAMWAVASAARAAASVAWVRDARVSGMSGDGTGTRGEQERQAGTREGGRARGENRLVRWTECRVKNHSDGGEAPLHGGAACAPRHERSHSRAQTLKPSRGPETGPRAQPYPCDYPVALSGYPVTPSLTGHARDSDHGAGR